MERERDPKADFMQCTERIPLHVQEPAIEYISGLDRDIVASAKKQLAQEDTMRAEGHWQPRLDRNGQRCASERLSDLVEELEAAATTLWPRRPEMIVAYRSWLAKARALTARLPELVSQMQHMQQEVKWLAPAEQCAPWETGEVDPQLETCCRQCGGLLRHLRGLDQLAADIERRLDVASAIEASTIGNPKTPWERAVKDIRDQQIYRGLVLRPQLGLVPLQRDPESGLWEFWLWESGDRPERDLNTGRWRIMNETGIVLVLLPEGTFKAGAQRGDPAGPNYDVGSEDNESPVHEVTLAPFLMSKYELTQGQWVRIVGHNPSWYSIENDARFVDPTCPLAHPVEQVSYQDCERALARLGLLLPTEAQWEYAARAGTETPWFTGADKRELKRVANIADRYCQTHGGPACRSYEDWDDDHTVHAPVGCFAPNAFGLHDVHGNVWEWCRDRLSSYTRPANPGDGERFGYSPNRVFRGGSFSLGAHHARSARRSSDLPEYRSSRLGCRPAMTLAAGTADGNCGR